MSSLPSTDLSNGAVETNPLILASVEDGIGRIVLNRPESMNAVSVELGRQLHAALVDVAARARVIIISGSNGNFSVGGDFNELERLRLAGREPMAELFDNFRAACNEIGKLPVPVIAAVEGYAMAGGFELMQSCDIAIVSENCRLADTHSNHGQVPGGGGSQMLPRLVGRQRASAHILTGDRLTAADAVAWGLAYKSFPAESFSHEVELLARKLADKDPVALAKSKRLIREGLALSLEEGLALERTTVLDHLAGGEAGAGIQAFTEKESGK